MLYPTYVDYSSCSLRQVTLAVLTDRTYHELMHQHCLLLDALARHQKAGFNPDEPRDDHGRWTSDGAPSYEDQAVPKTWANRDYKIFEDHFDKHAADFNATSWDDYANQANQFYQKFQDEKLPAVKGPDGNTRIYDPSSNTFGVYNSNGETVTFYKPDAASSYFQRVIEKNLAKGGRIINSLPVEPGGGGSGVLPFGNRRPLDKIEPLD